jgi:hypothetical protein
MIWVKLVGMEKENSSSSTSMIIKSIKKVVKEYIVNIFESRNVVHIILNGSDKPINKRNIMQGIKTGIKAVAIVFF